MNSNVIQRALVLGVLVASAAGAADLPPPADLKYAIRAGQKGMWLDGEALVKWRADDGRYTLTNESRAPIFGKILENRSEGLIDEYGIAPLTFYEKRFRKDPYTVTFDREAKAIHFTDGKLSYPIRGGEQDRASVPWQLSALARGNPAKVVPGAEWKMFVAGRRDGETWAFKVGKTDRLPTAMGEIEAVHLVKAPPAGSKEHRIDIWLAPAHEWYPVRVRFSDHDGDDVIEQTIAKITKR